MQNKIDTARINTAAIKLRQMLEMELDKVVDPVALLDIAKSKNIINDYKVSSQSEIGNADVEAQFDPDSKTLHLSKELFEKVLSGQPRARFTIAHELGHAFLGHSNPRNRLACTEYNLHGTNLKRDEQEANIFAAAFLIPESLANVNNATSAQRLSEEFAVSLKVAEIRLVELQKNRRLRSGTQRKIPYYIQEGINKLNNTTIPHKPTTIMAVINGDYETYMRAVHRQAKTYPDK